MEENLGCIGEMQLYLIGETHLWRPEMRKPLLKKLFLDMWKSCSYLLKDFVKDLKRVLRPEHCGIKLFGISQTVFKRETPKVLPRFLKDSVSKRLLKVTVFSLINTALVGLGSNILTGKRCWTFETVSSRYETVLDVEGKREIVAIFLANCSFLNSKSVSFWNVDGPKSFQNLEIEKKKGCN